MNIILHFAAEQRTETRENVVWFEIEWGSTNKVHMEFENGEEATAEGNGLTVSGGTINE